MLLIALDVETNKKLVQELLRVIFLNDILY